MAQTPKRPADSLHSNDQLGRMSTSSKYSPTRLPRPGIAISSSQRSDVPSNSHNQSSSPIASAPADPVGERILDEFSQKHLGNRNSMIASYNNSSKQRAQYYEQQFQYKDNVYSAVRERVQQESPVIAELRTNVIVQDEFTLVTDLSYFLAARYTRPDSAIMVKVDHSACLALGGTFDPCYILTITGIPSQMGPTTNKRNASVIQYFMADILSVPQERGIIKFAPVAEENFATNGTTMLGEIERQEKQQHSGDGGNAVRKAISNGRKSIPSFKKSSAKVDTELVKKDVKVEPIPSNTKATSSNANDVNGYQQGQGSISDPQMTVFSTSGVFELPAIEIERRPSTAHSHSTSNGSNGLRMNGISDVELTLKHLKGPNGRPKTFSGGTASIQDMIEAQAPSPLDDSAPAPPPILRSSPPLSRRERPPSFLTTDPSILPAKTSQPTSPIANSFQPSPVESISGPLRDSHHDGVTNTSPPAPRGPLPDTGKQPTITLQPSQEVTEQKEWAANTAKRRSTVTTAAAKVVESLPVPEVSNDTKSTKSFKMGKRKSFLSAFRRSAAAT